MRKELEAYLGAVTAKISSSAEAEEVRLELLDHVLTKAELLELSQGIGEEEAIRRVLREMGAQEELKEALGAVHNRLLKARIVYDTEKGQCGYAAKRLSHALGIPCDNVLAHPVLEDEELLILVKRGKYKGEGSREIMEFVKGLEKKRLKFVFVVELVWSFSKFFRAYYSGHVSKVDLTMGYADRYGDTSLMRMFREKGIEMAERKYCLRSPFLLGRVSGSELFYVTDALMHILRPGEIWY